MLRNRIPIEIPEEVDAVAARVVQCVGDVRRKLGVGLPERYYVIGLQREMTRAGLRFRSEPPFPVLYDGDVIGTVRPDFVVEDALVVEAKAVESLHAIHFAQTLTYVRATGLPLGLLVNFHAVPLGSGIRRVAAPP